MNTKVEHLIASTFIGTILAAGCGQPPDAPELKVALATEGQAPRSGTPLFTDDEIEQLPDDQGLDPGPDDAPALENGALAPTSAIEVQMGVDCQGLTGDAADYAVKNGICPDAKAVHPDNTRWGNCGSSWIYISNRKHGNAYVWWGFFSTAGIVVKRNLNASYLNYSTGARGNFVDSNWMGGSYYSKDRVFTTGAGNVAASLTGNVHLVWGGTCVILWPIDTTQITW